MRTLALALVALLCGPAASADPATAAQPVVVLVPGITGTMLARRDTGEVMWGDGRSLLYPRDDGYGTALSIAYGDRDEYSLAPIQVMRELRLVWRWRAYGPLIELMEGRGHRAAEFARADRDTTLLLFAYDWRQDAVRTARELLIQLERVHVVRGESTLPVALVCQSTGAHACRYLAKYGDASLDEAAAGGGGPPDWLDLRRVILVASANGGALRSLRELDRGRRYIRALGLGRRFTQETFASYRGLLQDLPDSVGDPFVDSEGRPVEADVFDVATWKRYGWSIFRREAQARLRDGDRRDLFGTPAEFEAYLGRALADARRFRALLHRDAPGFAAASYDLLHDDTVETPSRAVIIRNKDADGWHTFFAGDRELEQWPDLHDRIAEGGDGHVTRASLLWLSPQERAVLAAEPHPAAGGHFNLVHDPNAMQWIAERVEQGGTRHAAE